MKIEGKWYSKGLVKRHETGQMKIEGKWYSKGLVKRHVGNV